uniref:Uncharacterized protein n=1 Tax=Anguilla anguilla TaxID=7936 RepID=A0A0E9QX63_ANGAN
MLSVVYRINKNVHFTETHTYKIVKTREKFLQWSLNFLQSCMFFL